jgi:two-component system, cell cycle sensor histidine kinase and response regulator CckA
MGSRTIRIMLVDDDEDYFVLTRSLLLDGQGDRYQLEWIAQYDKATAALMNGDYDICLLDHDLGQQTGLELLEAIRSAGCSVPVIMLTGHGDRDLDLEAMRAGVTDYLAKAQLDGVQLERSIRYAIERRRTLQILEERERQIVELISGSRSGIVNWNARTLICGALKPCAMS